MRNTMDPPSHVAFRPAKSKAIPIIALDSGDWPALPQMPPSTFPLTNANGQPAIESEDNPDTSVGDGQRQVLDVYARPFVPEAFTIINKLHGHEINTPATKQINFGGYVSRRIGFDFLPPIPYPVTLPMDASFNLTDGVFSTYYESYFRYHLQREIESQHLENEFYSLYGHEIALLSDDSGQTTCSIPVPGLRENTPYVEEDDVVQLRQLRYDHKGKLFGMEEWLAPSSYFNCTNPVFHARGGRWRGQPAPGWTGTVCNARVSVVQRKHERLVVRAVGLMTSTKKTQHLKFNVQFPVPQERYLPMQQVLSVIQDAFRQANGSRNQRQDALGSSNAAQGICSTSTPKPQTRHPWLQSMLFPIQADCAVQTNLHPGFFKQPFLDEELNWEQKKAVESICLQNYGTLPFLISGPPGTGKTKTLVEIALQLLKTTNKASHVLFCAPSDPAADTIIQRIRMYFTQTELLRLNRPSRTFAEVPGAVLPFCYVSQNKFDLPPFKQLMSYKLIVTTCRDASLLLYSRLTNCDLYAAEYGLRTSIHPYAAQPSEVDLHWTALLMDESAQAIEPEALIPLSIVAPPLESVNLGFTPLFVMAGDEHQLGPRTSLRFTPLKTSLFARLFARPVYADHPLARGRTGKAPPPLNKAMLPIHRPAFTNLIRNYRSHPAILAVPSVLFYADTLEPEATHTDCLASWSEWRGRRWPVLFRDNGSEDDSEIDSGGWYNAGEAQIACGYAANLVQTGLVDQKEVCIMTPFKAQVQCLRKTIRDQKYGSLWEVDIGPTEAFQGLERGVVILCTTRSKQRFVNSDKAADWGIIGFPNKMNVALTRAKFGLIVIGRREILVQDPNWKAYLDFCDRNGLVSGETGGDDQLYDQDPAKLTRLEKVLVAKERDLKGRDVDDSRILRGRDEDDEMWTSGMTGMQELSIGENIDGYEFP